MNEPQLTVNISELLRRDPDQVYELLGDVWSGNKELPAGFNWHGLAEVAGQLARENGESEREEAALGWAGVATSIYDQLGNGRLKQYNYTDAGQHSFLVSSMMLRSAMISRYGPCPGDLVLDPDRIIRWFYEDLPLSSEDAARQLSAGWKGLDISTLMRLRRIKNKLRPIKSLVDQQIIAADADLNAWLALRDRLP